MFRRQSEVPKWFRDRVRSYIGSGHEQFTDEEIVAETCDIPKDIRSSDEVGRRLLYKMKTIPPGRASGNDS